MKKILFLKVKNVKEPTHSDSINLDWSTMYTSIESLVESVRMGYARNAYWVKEHVFNDDVEIPNTDVSIEDYQTNEGQKKHWNYHLSKLINLSVKEKLLEYTIEEEFGYAVHECLVFLVLELGGRDVFLTLTQNVDKDDFKCLELENVTDEYYPKFIEAINQNEIDDFVQTHTADEVEEKYISRYLKGNSNFSMWEL